MVEFACSQCKQSLEADESMQGQAVSCPLRRQISRFGRLVLSRKSTQKINVFMWIGYLWA